MTARYAMFATSLLSSVALPSTGLAATSTWTVFSSDFSNAAAWDTNPVAPGAADDVIINLGTANVTGSETVNSATIGNGGGTVGTIMVINGGTLTVTNGITLSDGLLEVHGGGTLNADVDGSGGVFTNNGTFNGTFTQSTGDHANHNSVIGSVTLTGGTFDNKAGATITGAVNVTGATLTNNGSAAGNVQILNGGRTMGTGSYGTLTIGNGGTIAPGNSIGTTTVTGNMVFAAGSTYEVEIDDTGASDLIDVTGSVTINGGTVNVLEAAGTYSASTVYTIITATGGVSGSFTTLTTNLAFLSPGLVYNANNVQLAFGRNATTYAAVGHTINQRGVGAAIDAGKVPDAIKNVITGMTAANARSAYDDISGDIYPSLGGLLLDDSHALRNTLVSRLAEKNPEQAAWFQAYGSWTHHFSADTSAPIVASSGGMLAGADGEIAEGWRLGAAGGYGYTFGSTGSKRAEANADTYSAAVYFGGEFGPVSFRSGASYSVHDADVERTIAFGGLNLAPRGSFTAETRQVFSELAYGIDIGGVKVEPFLNLAFVDYRSDALQETGGTGSLAISGIYDRAIYSLIGTRFAMETAIEDIPVELGGMVGWRHAHDAGSPAARVNFAGEAGFDVLGATVVEDTFLAELTARFKIAPATTLDASWQGSFAGQALNQKVSVKLGLAF